MKPEGCFGSGGAGPAGPGLGPRLGLTGLVAEVAVGAVHGGLQSAGLGLGRVLICCLLGRAGRLIPGFAGARRVSRCRSPRPLRLVLNLLGRLGGRLYRLPYRHAGQLAVQGVLVLPTLAPSYTPRHS